MRSQMTRSWSIDCLRVVAAFAVVGLHVSAVVMVNPGPIATQSWLVATFLNSLTRWAVPVFFMLSGQLVLTQALTQQSFSWATFFTKRARRLVIPTLGWTVVYLALWHQPASTWWHVIMFDQPFEHLYFLYCLALLYIASPILSWCYQRWPLPTVGFFLAVTWVWPGSRQLLLVWLPFVSYFLSGYVLSKTPIFAQFQKHRKWVGWGGIMVTLTIFLATMWLTLAHQATRNLAWTEYTHPIVMLQAICVWAFVQSFPPALRTDRARILIQNCSRLALMTLGVFVLHPLFVRLLSPMLIAHHAFGVVAIPLVTGMVFVICAGLTWLMKKIPVVRSFI